MSFMKAIHSPSGDHQMIPPGASRRADSSTVDATQTAAGMPP
jgi:hypothetical protein